MHPPNNLIILALLSLFLICDLELVALLRPETRNRFHLNGFRAYKYNPEVIKSARCMARYVSRTNLKIDIEIIAKRPIQSVWVHAVFFYKFNGVAYNRFPLDVWEDYCEFVDGKTERKFFLNWWLLRVKPFSNFNQSCPVTGFIVKNNNVPLDDIFGFDESIVPSGYYRVNVSLAEEDRVSFLEMVFYGTNAEHHLDKI